MHQRRRPAPLSLVLLTVATLVATWLVMGPAAGTAGGKARLTEHKFRDDLSNVDTRYWDTWKQGGALMGPADGMLEILVPTSAPEDGASYFGAGVLSPQGFAIKSDSYFTMGVTFSLRSWVTPNDISVILKAHYHGPKNASHNLWVGVRWDEELGETVFEADVDGSGKQRVVKGLSGYLVIARRSYGIVLLAGNDPNAKRPVLSMVYEPDHVGAVDWQVSVSGPGAIDRDWPVRVRLTDFEVVSEKGFTTPASWKK